METPGMSDGTPIVFEKTQVAVGEREAQVMSAFEKRGGERHEIPHF